MAYIGRRAWLAKIRKDKGFSQDLTAAMAGMSQAYYCKIENGFATPSAEQIAGVAGALGITYDDFVRMDKAARDEAKRRGVAKAMP